MLHTALSPAAIERLPTPKGVALALTKACRRDDVHLDAIASLVGSDPALSGRLLGLANAAAWSGRPLASTEEAVKRMGLVRVSQLALAFSLIDQHAGGACANFDYAGFWNRSLLMAAACRELGAGRAMGTPDELFTVGLLAQIGQLALATVFPEEVSRLVALDIPRAQRLQQEKAITGTDHLELSVALMEHWGVAADYARPFAQHEVANANPFSTNPEIADRARLAHCAWQLARVLSHADIDAVQADPDCQAALQWLQMDTQTITEYLHAIESTWRVWLQLVAL
jgi:HD-like signal output (HDOD) protein